MMCQADGVLGEDMGHGGTQSDGVGANIQDIVAKFFLTNERDCDLECWYHGGIGSGEERSVARGFVIVNEGVIIEAGQGADLADNICKEMTGQASWLEVAQVIRKMPLTRFF
jgi:hypothetical protein